MSERGSPEWRQRVAQSQGNLSIGEAREIREEYKRPDSPTQTELAESYGISQPMVSLIVNNVHYSEE